MKIIVDADACPRAVLTCCFDVAKSQGATVITVASFHHEINSPHHIMVGDASQESDIRIMNLTEHGDIVVTQDWALAAVVLAKGARALSPSGKVYRPEAAEFLLEEREIKARHRRGGGRTRGPSKRTPVDDLRFRKSLTALCREGRHLPQP